MNDIMKHCDNLLYLMFVYNDYFPILYSLYLSQYGHFQSLNVEHAQNQSIDWKISQLDAIYFYGYSFYYMPYFGHFL